MKQYIDDRCLTQRDHNEGRKYYVLNLLLKVPLFYQEEICFPEVSLRASHYSFIIANDRD